MPSKKFAAKPAKDNVTIFEAIGTRWSIESAAPHKVLDAIHGLIETYDQQYSRFRTDSLVTAMADSAGAYRLPADAQPLFDLYRDLYNISKGIITPLIGQVLADAGYDAKYSLAAKQLVRPPGWEQVINYDFPTLTLTQPALLDLGALGKGYLVDLVAGLLKDNGVTIYYIDAGGDILHQGDMAEIGLEHPAHADQAIGVAYLQNQSLCGSSGNRRAWDGYHHIINPETLRSPDHIAAVWAIADSALLADAMTTALFFVSPETLRERYTFEYAIMHSNNSLTYSKNFPASFF